MANFFHLIFKKANPDSPAILSAAGEILSFERLKNDSTEILKALKNLGVAKGEKVAILGGDGPEALAAIAAIAQNFTCVPINSRLKNAEIQEIIFDLGIGTLIIPAGEPCRLDLKEITVLKIYRRPPSQKIKIKIIRKILKKTSRRKKSNTGAFIIITSGTTAKSKYVTLSHKNLIANAKNMKEVLRLKVLDRCLNVMPFFHVHGLMTALSSLAAGTSVICPPKFEAAKFFSWWAKTKPTWYTASPIIHQAILHAARENLPLIRKNSIRLIRSSSASLAPRILKELETVFRAPVLESYGMTEATLQITSNLLPPLKRKNGSVGKPVGVRLNIIGKTGQRLKKGEIGEIIIKGDAIIKKYEGDIAENKTSFFRGWLKTGDLGRLDQDGYLYIVGRIKEMINKGGENIYPKEIENIFLRHPAIAQVAVFGVPHKTLGEDIALAAVLQEKIEISEKELRDFALKNLSEFKVPGRIIFTKKLPKTQTGKVQRFKLYAKFQKALTDKKSPQPVRVSADKKIIKIWQEVLRIKEIKPDDNFFEAGGDSLSLEELFLKIKRGGFKISKRSFLINPRLRQLLTQK